MNSKQVGYVGQRKSDGKWYARVQVNGQDKTKWAKTEAQAVELLEQLRVECGLLAIAAPPVAPVSPGHTAEGATLLFSAILNEFERVRVTEAQHRNDRKVSGMRSVRTVKICLSVLRDYLGALPVASITPSVIDRFRSERLAKPVQFNGKERSIASVNRELEMLRGVLLWALGEGYINRAPKVRITKAHETKRERVLSLAEERRLIKACDTPHRRHIIPVVIAAIDTGARKGELLALRWSDFTLLNPRLGATITLRATTTKTNKAHVLPVSDRLMKALESLPATDDPNGRVFPMKVLQKSFDAACRDAKIEDLRFHDLRATFITRLIEKGMSVELVAKLSGHQDVSTLYSHYLRPKNDALAQARDLLNRNA